MRKFQQMVSGSFCSDEGSQALDNIPSYIFTAAKHGTPMHESIHIHAAVSGNSLFTYKNP